MKKIAFIITKPLQLLVAIAIIDEISEEVVVDLIITNDFFNAELISKKIDQNLRSALKQIQRVIFFNRQSLAYKSLAHSNYSQIYIDSDVGLRRYFELIKIKIRCQKLKISVYEEGLGSYRRDIYDKKGLYAFVKKHVLRAIGVGVNFGGNFLVSEIYLFSPNEYSVSQNHKIVVKRIKCSIEDVLDKFSTLSGSVFSLPSQLTEIFSAKLNSCSIYLSNWHVDRKTIEKISKTGDIVLIKPHPHIKITESNQGEVIYVDQSIPAEILLREASQYFKTITVFHHGSSITRYINRGNIKFVLIE